MAIRRIILNQFGETKEVMLTPLKAIRVYCLTLCKLTAGEVNSCRDTYCPFYSFRHGQNPNKHSL